MRRPKIVVLPIRPAEPEAKKANETGLRLAMAALNEPDASNPIANEVARLVRGYAENFREHVQRLGHMPDSFLRVKPETAIEAVAMRLTTETIQEVITDRVP
jgi:hypothetical protein